MADKKFEFTGKEVADAIKAACEKLDVPQERLDIEVLETGSSGIFGLIRKKAKIRVTVQEQESIEPVVESQALTEPKQSLRKTEAMKNGGKRATEKGKPRATAKAAPEKQFAKKEFNPPQEDLVPVSAESVALVKEVLIELLEKMEFPSTVEVSSEGIEVLCKITGEYEEYLTGQDGRTVDSIQYILRKIVARKTPERIKLSVDVGNYRDEREEGLKQKAAELAELVKADGKTQVIPALNPSERRVVHMVLQDDKEIRSRSVGDGLFKKILIYKPGKSKGDGRKRNYNKNRRGKGNRAGNSQG